MIPFHTGITSLVAFQRPGVGSLVLVLANVGEETVFVDALTLSGFDGRAQDLLEDREVSLEAGIRVPAHGIRWLRVSAR